MTFLAGLGVGVLQYYKDLMSKRAFLYIFIPTLLLPTAITATYIPWPESSLNLIIRLLIAIAIEIVALAQFYLFSFPLFKAMMPKVREYFEDDENRKSE